MCKMTKKLSLVLLIIIMIGSTSCMKPSYDEFDKSQDKYIECFRQNKDDLSKCDELKESVKKEFENREPSRQWSDEL